jgi:hypothetical protein
MMTVWDLSAIGCQDEKAGYDFVVKRQKKGLTKVCQAGTCCCADQQGIEALLIP